MGSTRTRIRALASCAAAAAAVGAIAAVAAVALPVSSAPGAAAAPAAGATASAAGCPRAGALAAGIPRNVVRRAVACVANRFRARRDRRPVRRQRHLRRIAQRHVRVMVRRGCLRARCPGQPPLAKRIRSSGYTNGARRWRFALNTGCARSAGAMVRAWRRSRYHRANMMRPAFHHVGVGISPRATAAPCRGRWSTFAALFAHRVR